MTDNFGLRIGIEGERDFKKGSRYQLKMSSARDETRGVAVFIPG